MLPSMELKNLRQVDRYKLEKEIKSQDLPENVQTFWLNKLNSVMESEFPGKPDELWRRIDQSQWNIEQLPMINAFLEHEDLSGEAEIYPINECPTKIKQDFQYRYAESFEEFRGKYMKRSNEVRDNKYSNMVSAFSSNGFAVRIPDEISSDKIIRLRVRHPGGEYLCLPQVYIHVGSRSDVKIVLETEGGNRGSVMFMNVKIIIEPSSRLRIFSFDDHSTDSRIMNFHEAWIHSDSDVESDFISTGNRTAVNIHEHMLLGKGAKTAIYGLTNTEPEQLSANKVVTYHHAPHTHSDFQVQSVVKGKGHSVYVGNIQMPEDSQKCEGYQVNNHLLLDKQSHVETLPQLEIIANDVKCSHGATLSDLDPIHLFYLQSRGLDEDTARNLMIRSYYNKMLNKMAMLKDHPALHGEVVELFRNRLGLDMSDMGGFNV